VNQAPPNDRKIGYKSRLTSANVLEEFSRFNESFGTKKKDNYLNMKKYTIQSPSASQLQMVTN
jgi:hypothetical protein